jgi:citrate lyase subunit beta / citryl-CoA lyase
MRSLLFVPADSPRKLAKAFDCDADALILDLEDSVALAQKPKARAGAQEFLAAAKARSARPKLLLRLNALDSGEIEADLDVIAKVAPDAVVLPKSTGGADVQRLSAKLAVREAEGGEPDGCVRILPIATESGAAMFGLGAYAGSSHRLMALTWGAEDLSADLGAETNRLPDGRFTEPYRLARCLLLFAAAAAAVDAIDGVYARLKDEKGLRLECEEARRDGFVGKIAIHPEQIAIINETFAPSPAAILRAQKIVEAFAARPDAGALAIEGEMIDAPHLRRAERLLRRVNGG